ncbi:MAG: serine/threonine-protein kinase [Pirellulales bacterium]
MQLVAGSGPRLTDETQTLLRCRLRMSALMLAIGFGLFFVYNSYALWDQFSDPLTFWFWLATGGIAGILGTVGGGLCRQCQYSAGVLRSIELLVFGVPAVFFCALNILEMHRLHEFYEGAATKRVAFLENPIIPWMLLIFNYSIFIPNTWKRAAIPISLMVLLPMVVLVVSHNVCSMAADAYDTQMIVSSFLRITLTAVTGVAGVAVINRLRSEAFEAKSLGQYKLRRLIGAGGMGEVYLAEHRMMKRPCAIKLIRPNKAGDPQALARFEREVRATARLSHWNSIEIYDYGRSDDGTFYYVMEYLPGMNLGNIVERYGPLPPERAVYLLTQICDALVEAHDLDLIHRDIKPGNVYSAYRGGRYDVAKLLDFGLAKPMHTTQTNDLDLTVAGSITGSPLYMSPEQATGDGVPDLRSDIYSLGATAYYLLTGRSPFTGDNPIKIMMAHAMQEPTPPSRVRRELPAELDAIIMKCLSKRPDDRYQCTVQLGRALRATNLGEQWTTERADAWWEAHCEIHHDEACRESQEIAEQPI